MILAGYGSGHAWELPSVPKGQQELAGGFSRRIGSDPRPSPNGTAEAIP